MKTIEIDQKNQYILGVVATRETKKWPLEYYAKLSRKLSGKVIIPLSKSSSDMKIRNSLERMDLADNVEFVHAPLSELPEILSGSKATLETIPA